MEPSWPRRPSAARPPPAGSRSASTTRWRSTPIRPTSPPITRPAGHYAATNGYFATGGFDSPPLHALGDGVDGPNGVYHYDSAGGSAFPTSTFQSSNYWVDVVFENTVGPDTTPPTITARSPADGATNVSTGANVTATFSEPMDPATINGTNFELRDPSNAVVPATVTYDAAQRRAILDPTSALQNSTTYTATVKGGRRRRH